MTFSEPPPIWAVILIVALGAATVGCMLAFAIATPRRRLLFASIGVFNLLTMLFNVFVLLTRAGEFR